MQAFLLLQKMMITLIGISNIMQILEYFSKTAFKKYFEYHPSILNSFKNSYNICFVSV